MKLLSAAIGLLSLGILTGCVDDSGYRSGGYYATGVQYRSYDRSYDRYYDRRYRDDRRYWNDRRRDDRRSWEQRDNRREERVRRDVPRDFPPAGRNGPLPNGKVYPRAILNGEPVYLNR